MSYIPEDKILVTLPKKVTTFSRELVCLHEAGHIATAVAIGAVVTNCVIGPQHDLHGVTSVRSNMEQRPLIACGGLATEYHLLKTGRLTGNQGNPTSYEEFLIEAAQNAADDLERYVDSIQQLTGRQLAQPFDDFLGHALTDVHDQLDFDLVEELGERLLASNQLNERDIMRAVGGSVGPSPITDYRMQRMYGRGKTKAAIMSLTNRTKLPDL